MLNFKELIEKSNPERLEYTVTIEGNPVWDYKVAGYKTVSLIANIQGGIEEEYVSLGELRKYIVSCEIPFDITVLQTETDKEPVILHKWYDENKELCLFLK